MTLSPSALAASIHPVFPWEGRNGEGAWINILVLIAVPALLIAGVVFLAVRLFRRFRRR